MPGQTFSEETQCHSAQVYVATLVGQPRTAVTRRVGFRRPTAHCTICQHGHTPKQHADAEQDASDLVLDRVPPGPWPRKERAGRYTQDRQNRGGAEVIVLMVASAGHRRANVDLDDPNSERHPYEAYTAYGRSKTATILFAVEFDQRHSSTGTRAAAVHPGAIMTETVQEMVAGLGDAKDAAVAAYDWKTVPQGAATAVWAGLVASADDIGGRYCEDCHVAPVDDDPNSRTGVRSYAVNPENAHALWVKSEKMVGERF